MHKDNHKEKTAKPFVQWIGSKRKITNQLINYIPKGVKNYYEPFLGGGALFFSARHLFDKCYLSDINLNLVTSYNAIKNNPDSVYRQVMELNSKHTEDQYYKLSQHNYTNNPIGITARFIYVNKHSFKGLFRINHKGTITSTCDTTKNWRGVGFKQILAKCSKQLSKASICANDFSFISPEKDYFVYLDPPYHKSGESFYTRLPFDEDEQIRLKDFVMCLNDKGVKIMISNSDTNFIRDLYSSFDITQIETKYELSKKQAKELIITNYPKPITA